MVRPLRHHLLACIVALTVFAGPTQAVVINKLYWSSNTTDLILRCNLDGSRIETVVSSPVNPEGPAIAFGAQKMYWSVQVPSVIQRANLDGTSIETIISGLRPNAVGIAVDEAHDRLFWTEGEGHVYRSTLNGGSKTELWSTSNRPLGIAHDPVANKVYWVETFHAYTGGTPHIRRANFDGSGMEDLVLSGLSDPFSLTLDPVHRKMYWGDRGDHTIRRANLDGTGVQTLVSSVTDPSALAVDSSTGYLYYANGSSIMRARLDGTNPAVFVSGQTLVFGLAVIPAPEPATFVLVMVAGVLTLTRRRS